jgi:nucleotide-binding universal stress UspA family protein
MDDLPHQTYNKILFGTDFSENADRAFVFAVNTAARNAGCELHLLHVIPEPSAQFWKGYIYEVDEDVDARARREIDEKLAETYRPRVPDGQKLVIAMRIGEAGQQIVEYAKEQDIDLVIVGRQGAGKVGKLLFGNVTERVVRKAPCPVLVIPPTGP